jgi:hypothetical protein
MLKSGACMARAEYALGGIVLSNPNEHGFLKDHFGAF